MNEIAKQANDVTIFDNGDAYISQVKLSELSGIPRSTLQDWIKSGTPKNEIKVNENNQIHYSSLSKIIKSGTLKGYGKCIELLDMLIEAGAKAYLYHLAGYKMDAVRTEPQNYIEALRALADSLEAKERAEKDVKRLSAQLDKSKEWLTIKKVAFHNNMDWKELNWRPLVNCEASKKHHPYKIFDANFPKGVNVYHIDAWIECYPELNFEID